MVDPGLFAAFVAAVTVLMLIPGPNVALIVANSVSHGPRYGLLTVAGTSTATVVQLVLVALGLAGVLAALGGWLDWVRWAGAAYLVCLGIAQWRTPPVDLARTRPQPRAPRVIVARGFLVSLSNPKTLLFYGAFFPQFVAADRPAGPQVAVLCVTVLALAVGIDSGWALGAARVRGVLLARGRLRNRLTGGLLIGTGTALALARSR